ncbi:sterol carrier protein domain-containing protein [uncultured Desulfovibrio sp.]
MTAANSHGAAPLIEMGIQSLTAMLMGYKRPTYL